MIIRIFDLREVEFVAINKVNKFNPPAFYFDLFEIIKFLSLISVATDRICYYPSAT